MPENIVRTWRKARQLVGNINESSVRNALQHLEPVWNELRLPAAIEANACDEG